MCEWVEEEKEERKKEETNTACKPVVPWVKKLKKKGCLPGQGALSSFPQGRVTCNVLLLPCACLSSTLSLSLILCSFPFIPRPAFSALHPRCSSSQHSSLSFLCASHLSYSSSRCANIFPRNHPTIIPALTCHSHSNILGETSRQESWSRES